MADRDLIKPVKDKPRIKDYRRWFGTLIGASMLKDVTILVLIGACIYLYKLQPEDRYFSVDDHGKLKELVNLGIPNVKPNGVKNWVSEAMTESYSFNFKNMEQRIHKNCTEYYTEKGCEEYMRAHDQIGNIKRVKEGNLIVSAVPIGVPIIKSEQKDLKNRYHWIIHIPMLITYTGSYDVTSKVLFEVDVVRSSVYAHKRGLAIDSHIYKPMTDG